MPCKSGIIPSIDLSKWADFGHDGSPHQYVSILFLFGNCVEESVNK